MLLKTKATQFNVKQLFFRWRFAKKYSFDFIQYRLSDKRMNFGFDSIFRFNDCHWSELEVIAFLPRRTWSAIK